MKVIDKRKKGVTYSIGDWFEYGGNVIQLVGIEHKTISFVEHGDSWTGVKVKDVCAITQTEMDQLPIVVGKKVNVEIHIVSDAE